MDLGFFGKLRYKKDSGICASRAELGKLEAGMEACMICSASCSVSSCRDVFYKQRGLA